MKCYSCNKHKNQLKQAQSVLMPSMKLLLCDDCRRGKFEPRWIVILAGRQKGTGSVPDNVREVIVKRRYHGATINFDEIFG